MTDSMLFAGFFICVSVLYSLSVMRFHAQFFPLRYSMPVTIASVIVIDAIGCVLAVTVLTTQMGYVETLVAYYLVGLIFFKYEKNHFWNALFLPGIYIFIILSFMGIFMAATSLILGLSPVQLTSDPTLYNISATCHFLLGLIVINLLIQSKKVEDGFREIFKNTTTLIFVDVVMTFLLLGLFFTAYYFLIAPFSVETSALFAFSSISFLVLFIVTIIFGMRAAAMDATEMKSKQVEKQMESQMLHYRSYADYTRSIRKFREIYKDMMGNVYDLHQQEKYAEAKREIDRINDLFGEMVVVHKEYSNHALLDAVMQGVANQCADSEIPFKAKIYAPTSFGMSDTDLCQLFVDIMDAFIKYERNYEGEKMISFGSNKRGEWILIRGELRANEDIGQTKDFLNIKQQLEQKAQAMVSEEFNESTNTYAIVMCFRP